jgi:hypothetical protein
MKRIVKVAVACIGVVAVLAFFFLAPVVPMNVFLPPLLNQHGLCGIGSRGGEIYASPSYKLLNSGVVYVPTGSHLWWMPGPGSPPGSGCA